MKTHVTLVTGAAGFAGQHLLDQLTKEGQVHGWYRPGGTQPTNFPGVHWHGVELNDRAAVRSAIAAIAPTRLFHLAGAPSVETSWTNAVPHLRINVMGTAQLLQAVRTTGSSCRVLVVTSAQIYSASDLPLREDAPLVPQSPYGLTKLAQDQLATLAAGSDGLDVVVARPFNHIGPRQTPDFAVSSFARQIARIERGLEPPVLRVGNLESRRDITDVRDVVAAYVRIMEDGRSGRAYNVCSGGAWRIHDLLDELLRLSTVSISLETDPARLRPSDVPVIQGDAARIRTELGWTPHIRVEDTLRDTLEWWRTQVAASGEVRGATR